MAELPEWDPEDIRDYVFDNSENFPELEDLPARWRGLKKAFKPDGHPRVEAMKTAMIEYYVDCSRKRLWAWEGLHRLLVETKGDEPEPLRQWACEVVRDKLKAPPKSRGNRSEHNRNFRIAILVKHLKECGLKHEEAIAKVSEALTYSARPPLSENTVRSALERSRKVRMR